MRVSPSLAILLALTAAAAPGIAEAKDPIAVNIDMAKVMRVSAPAATVVVGNPGIADATVQDRQTLVITGKMAGLTNLVVLDAKGQLIADEVINVIKPQAGYVTVQRGGARYSYACTPHCNAMVEPGDEKTYFEGAESQLRKRIEMGQQSAGATP